jgi:hypothetical protein
MPAREELSMKDDSLELERKPMKFQRDDYVKPKRGHGEIAVIEPATGRIESKYMPLLPGKVVAISPFERGQVVMVETSQGRTPWILSGYYDLDRRPVLEPDGMRLKPRDEW